MVSRLQRLIPLGWFPSGLSPLRDALITGIANALAFAYSLLAYVRLQTRIATATDAFLDLIAGDFFGASLPRQAGESDASYRARIQTALFRERSTRKAVILILEQLTGRTPIVYEPQRPADTGGYSTIGLFYGAAGGYGSRSIPQQAFVTAYRPIGAGVPNVAGYGDPEGGYSSPSQLEYVNLESLAGTVSDTDIIDAVESVRPVDCTLWVKIES
ncbi:MAG: hypothetical protein ACRES6_09330 [Steroidobacteraceae bacterium]